MSELIPGLIVERMIPPDVWVGLMTGKYDLFGSVVRVAKGLPNDMFICSVRCNNGLGIVFMKS